MADQLLRNIIHGYHAADGNDADDFPAWCIVQTFTYNDQAAISLCAGILSVLQVCGSCARLCKKDLVLLGTGAVQFGSDYLHAENISSEEED